MMLKKLKFYGLISLGITSSFMYYKMIRDNQTKEMKKIGTVIANDDYFKKYNKTYDDNKVIYYDEDERYEEIKTPILIGLKLEEDEKIYCYSKKMS